MRDNRAGVGSGRSPIHPGSPLRVGVGELLERLQEALVPVLTLHDDSCNPRRLDHDRRPIEALAATARKSSPCQIGFEAGRVADYEHGVVDEADEVAAVGMRLVARDVISTLLTLHLDIDHNWGQHRGGVERCAEWSSFSESCQS